MQGRGSLLAPRHVCRVEGRYWRQGMYAGSRIATGAKACMQGRGSLLALRHVCRVEGIAVNPGASLAARTGGIVGPC